MSIRTGNRGRHNRRLKQFARNRVRTRALRAELIAAAAAGTTVAAAQPKNEEKPAAV